MFSVGERSSVGLFILQDLLHAQEPIQQTERDEKKKPGQYVSFNLSYKEPSGRVLLEIDWTNHLFNTIYHGLTLAYQTNRASQGKERVVNKFSRQTGCKTVQHSVDLLTEALFCVDQETNKLVLSSGIGKCLVISEILNISCVVCQH